MASLREKIPIAKQQLHCLEKRRKNNFEIRLDYRLNLKKAIPNRKGETMGS
jgi:hypothetical protein